LFLLAMLATNGIVQDRGVITWFGFLPLPAADGYRVQAGLLLLLPLLGVLCWLPSRAASVPRRWQWGWWPVPLAMAALGLLAVASVGGRCLRHDCDPTLLLRLLLLLALFWWVYGFVLNERPSLFWIFVVVITLQSSVAIAQFLLQHDLGLRFLGELVLDPQDIGTSVVISNGRRWLRGYGLTRHPNALSQTVILSLFYLLATLHQQPRPWLPTARLLALLFLLVLFGTLVALSRWAWVCLAVGLLLYAWPFLRTVWERRRLPPFPRPHRRLVLAVAAILILGGLLYGGAAVGRFTNLDHPVESRSLWERERDVAISLLLIRQHPWSGIGYGNYLAQAVRLDWWAEIVHTVPLRLGAEMGMPALALWLVFLIAPLLRVERDAAPERPLDAGYFSIPPSGSLPYPLTPLAAAAARKALWLVFGLLGLLYLGPNPLADVRSALLAGVITAVVARGRQ
jgi:O-antigen ligase